MTRELCKAWTGFRSVKGHVVATGHWGCGAFGGDPNIKCLLQVMAASMAEVKQLDFYCFNDEACEIIFAINMLKKSFATSLFFRPTEQCKIISREGLPRRL